MCKIESKEIPVLLLILAICLLVGFAGGIETSSSLSTWYSTLNKPFFNPPNWLFAPVWTALYVLMAVAFFFVARKGIRYDSVKEASELFAGQLALNYMWSIIFFTNHNLKCSFLEIIALLILIVLTTRRFYFVSKKAAWLMVPYIAWVTIASVLNLSIVLLNP